MTRMTNKTGKHLKINFLVKVSITKEEKKKSIKRKRQKQIVILYLTLKKIQKKKYRNGLISNKDQKN